MAFHSFHHLTPLPPAPAFGRRKVYRASHNPPRVLFETGYLREGFRLRNLRTVTGFIVPGLFREDELDAVVLLAVDWWEDPGCRLWLEFEAGLDVDESSG